MSVASTPHVRTESSRVVDIAVPGSSTLRLALVTDGSAGPTLVVSQGFGGGAEPFRRPDYCGPPIRLPPSVLPDLVEALGALGDELSRILHWAHRGGMKNTA